MIVALIPTNVVTNLLLCPFLSCRRIQNFQEDGRLITKNISIFCLLRVALDLSGMWNSNDFYKGLLLKLIYVHITVPWFQQFMCNLSSDITLKTLLTILLQAI